MTDETSAAGWGNAEDLGRSFSDIDASGDLDRMVANLDFSESLPHLTPVRERTYELLSANSGDVVVDVGCGTGTVVGEMVTRGLKAIGVDLSTQMVAVAQRRHPELDLRVASAESLPFADGEVAGYRAERLYMHVPDPAACAAEAHRVLGSGGRLVLVDQDWDALVVDADDHELTRRILRGLADSISNPWIGRRYRNLLLDVGFDDVAVEVMTVIFTEPAISPMASALPEPAVVAGLITRAEADDWVAEQRRHVEQGRFFMAMPMFFASARRP